MRLPILPCAYVPHHRPKLEQLETLNPGVQQQISKESRVDQGGATAPKLQQPSPSHPRSAACLALPPHRSLVKWHRNQTKASAYSGSKPSPAPSTASFTHDSAPEALTWPDRLPSMSTRFSRINAGLNACRHITPPATATAA